MIFSHIQSVGIPDVLVAWPCWATYTTLGQPQNADDERQQTV